MNNLKELRERVGLKQTALARELNVKNQASISEWETGRKGLSLENAIMFAKYFGVSVGVIAGTEPIPEGYPDSGGEPINYKEVIKQVDLRAAEPEPTFKRKKAPFTKEQLSFLGDMLDEREERLAGRIVAALKEDSSSFSGQEAT